jgi:uncharacterized membrane protein
MEGWVPEPTKRVFFVSAETATDRAAATHFRTRNFPPGAVTPLTSMVIAIDGTPTANPGPLRELVLPIAQAIRGGVYGQTVLFVSSAMDGVGDYLQDLAFANDVGLYWSENPDDLESARPVGDLTPTERSTLGLLKDVGGRATASDLAERAGIEATAAGNRLVNLVRKGYVYRWERPRSEGDLFVDPRVANSAT